MTYKEGIRLSAIISSAFSEPHRALKTGTHNQIVSKGGRGSAKSSWASIEGVLKLIETPDIHGVVLRKVAVTLRTSVYAQYVWAVTTLGLYNHFKFTVSPMEITYKKTGQKMMFFGADEPAKLKSIKVPFGYIGYLHIEELDQFAGGEEVRNIEQSILRGGELAFEIKTFNPPKTKDNWANKYCQLDKPGQLIHTSTYLTTPKEWLGKRFIDDAEYLKETNPKAYEHEYIGIPNSTGGLVFDNLKAEEITEAQVNVFDRALNGIDWGWYPDPWTFNRMYYASARRTLYIFDEARANKKSNIDTAEIVKKKINPEDKVYCDSAEPKSIEDYFKYGIRARGAVKGAGSVDYSHKWLQSLNKIVVDPRRCPYTYKEFSNYEYERDKQGEVISGYPDKDNHHIDATRYATERIWRCWGK